MTVKTTLIALLFLFAYNANAQSPWVNNKGSFYGQISGTYLGYSSVINDTVNQIVQTGVPTRDITANLFGEYSVTDKLAVLASVPFKFVSHDGQSLSSLGDPSVKVKYQFSKNVPVAGYLGYTAPLSKREGVLRTGYNQHTAEGGFSIGRGKERSYIYGGLGFRYRTNISNQVLIEFEYGYQFKIADRPLYAIFRVDGMLNISDVNDPEAGLANLYHTNGEFVSPALKFSYNGFGNFWINLGVHSAVFVRNFGAASTFNLGVAYKLEK
ncbi:MAG: hypothetical protein AB8B56_05450 [Crocinitomicaceae bacterium]